MKFSAFFEFWNGHFIRYFTPLAYFSKNKTTAWRLTPSQFSSLKLQVIATPLVKSGIVLQRLQSQRNTFSWHLLHGPNVSNNLWMLDFEKTVSWRQSFPISWPCREHCYFPSTDVSILPNSSHPSLRKAGCGVHLEGGGEFWCFMGSKKAMNYISEPRF